MKIKRRKEILVEHERNITIKFSSIAAEKFCQSCAAPSRFITTDEAALSCNTTSLTIFRLVETKKIHSLETTEGLLLICFASLLNFKEKNLLL